MDEHPMRLDGNAMGGLLSDVFAGDPTMMRSACAGCGTVVEVGAQYLYMHPGSPGAVLRCATCETILMVTVHLRDRMRIGFPGLRWVEVTG